MAGRRIRSPQIKESEHPYSKAMEAGGFVFVSGLVPRRQDGTLIEDDIREGTRRCMEDMAAILSAAGASLADLVKVNIHLKQLADFAAMNEVYRTFFREDPPARATAQAGQMNAVLEVEGIAYKG